MHPGDEQALSEAAEAVGGRDTDIGTGMDMMDEGHMHGGFASGAGAGGSTGGRMGKHPSSSVGTAAKIKRRMSFGRLPEGVEGVFEPSVGSSRSQGAVQSVSGVEECFGSGILVPAQAANMAWSEERQNSLAIGRN